MSSLRAVNRNSLITVMILSSTVWMVRFKSLNSSWRVLISCIAFLWLVSMFCSRRSCFLRISLKRSSLMRRRAEMMLTWSAGAVASGSAILPAWLGFGGAFGSAMLGFSL